MAIRTLRTRDLVFLAHGDVEGVQIARDARLDLLDAALDRRRGDVAIACVHRFEAAAVESHDTTGQDVELAARHHELAAGVLYPWAVVAPDGGDGRDVGGEVAGQPHQLDVAASLTVQAAAGGDSVEVAVEVELQQCRGILSGPARRGRRHTRKTKCRKIEFIHKHIDDANRIVLGPVVVQAMRQKRDLVTIRTTNEPRHTSGYRHAETIRLTAFTHSLGGNQKSIDF